MTSHLAVTATEGLRERLISKGWHMRGAFADRYVRGQRLMVFTVREEGERTLLRFVPGSVFWGEILEDDEETKEAPAAPPNSEPARDRTSDYIDLKELLCRGWSAGMVDRRLGAPDTWLSVDHFLNRAGKRAWLRAKAFAAESESDVRREIERLAERRGLHAADVLALAVVTEGA